MATINYSWQYRRERNTAMKVFSQLFVGIGPEREGEIPLAFATPYEENAAGRKRQETVRNWLSGRRTPKVKDGKYVYVGHVLQYEDDKSVERIVENVPREGFRVTDDVKRVYWGGGNVVWRIADPDGWEVEIQSANLMAIIQSAGIQEGGLIPGKCVWGRAEGINVLLHETSDEYKDAIKAAETLKAPKQVGKAGREVGGVYRLVDGTLAVYLGKVHVSKIDYGDETTSGNVKLQFPPLAGAPLGSRTEALGNWSRYELQPSVPYEAVVRYYEDKKLDPVMLLYKKAPLVDHVGVYKLPEVTNALLDSFDWKFASSATTCVRIMSVTTEPVVEPVLKLLPWTDKQYDTARKKLKERGERMFKDYGMYPGVWFKSGEHAIVLDDVLCGDIGVAGETTFSNRGTPTLPYAIQLVVGTENFTVMTATDNDRYVYTADRWYGYNTSRGPLYPEPGKIVPIHGINSYADYEAWFEKVYNDRALFNIVVRNK